jgi:hypothetical protein
MTMDMTAIRRFLTLLSSTSQDRPRSPPTEHTPTPVCSMRVLPGASHVMEYYAKQPGRNDHGPYESPDSVLA